MTINKYFNNKSILTLKYKDSSLEKNYNNYMQELKFIQMKYAPFLTSFFYIWFWIIDFELANSVQLDKTQFFHISMIIVLLIPFILSFFKPLHKLMYFTLLFAPIYAAVGNIYLAKIGMNVYLPDIYLIMIWSFVMAGFYFYESIILNLIMLLITSVFYFLFDILSPYYLEVHGVYILIALVIGAFANYSMEFASRINFESNKLLEKQQLEIKEFHKNIQDSVEYASLIQRALIPLKETMSPYFSDHFVIWIPKDTVGGDIWLFSKLRNEDECLLFFIDCTGHGIPGAFVTMIIKAIEREVVANLKKHPEFDISPAIIMSYFNKTMKTLLRQETKSSLSNVGWDGGIIYYNKRSKILKFAGAETPLFYVDLDGTINTIKGNRYSVGYKRCDINYEYKETVLKVQEGMKFYCTTDGYLDQNGGEKSFPFGKTRFKKIIEKTHNESMLIQKNNFISTMKEYENIMEHNNDRNDDMTVIGFTI